MSWALLQLVAFPNPLGDDLSHVTMDVPNCHRLRNRFRSQRSKDSLCLHQNSMPVSTVDQLYQLQQIDLRLAQLQRTISALDDGTAARTDIDRQQAERQASEIDLRAKHAQMRRLELELQSTTDKAHKVEADLYSGRIGNPKELSAMQEDVQALERQRQRLEDEILALMEETERLQGGLRTLEESVTIAQQALERALAQYRTQQDALTDEVQRVQAERAALVTRIEEHALRRYEFLRERKGGIAVAQVIRGICEGCHVAIPEHRLTQLLESETDQIYTCEGCGRILHAKAR